MEGGLSRGDATGEGRASGGAALPSCEGIFTYRDIIDATSDALFIHDSTGMIVDVNQATCTMFRCTRDEILAASGDAFCLGTSPYSPREAGEFLGVALRDGAATFDWRSRRYDGELFWSQVALRRATVGGQTFIVASVRDISPQRSAEEALRASEERFRALASIASEGIMIHDGERVLDANPAFVEMVGCKDRLELIGRHRLHGIPLTEESRRRVIERHESGSTVPYDIEMVRPDGTVFHGETLGRDATWLGRKVRLVYIRDVGARRRVEQERRASEARFRHLFEAGPDALWVHDRKGKILDVNHAMCRSVGYTREEMLQLDVADVGMAYSAETMHELYENVARHGHFEFEGAHRRRDGSTFPVDVTITQLETDRGTLYFSSMRDSSMRRRQEAERARLEESLRHAQKLESIGRLAGGVAHDFNNLLTAISGNLSLAMIDVTPSDPTYELLREVDKAADSAAKLTRQLLAFSRKQVIDPRVLRVNDLVLQLQKMLQRLIGEDVVLCVGLATDLASVHMDPGQLEQVLVNLAVNARDAMPEGGRLDIGTRNVVLDDAYCGERPGVEPGPYVELSVADEGTGLSEAARAHLFEPFFTTKEVGRGTGLGLAMVYGAVRQNGGDIQVESTPERGTRFRIYLPAVTLPADPVSTPRPLDLPRGTETIVLVEDDDAVRGMAVRLLRRQGYTVRDFANGGDALAAFEAVGASSAPEARVDLLVTDVVMPGMSGRVLAERVRAVRPELKLLFTSGYTADSGVPSGMPLLGVEFLPKPYTLAILAVRVRDVLDKR
jgi:PAS domain S-box-containing protein